MARMLGRSKSLRMLKGSHKETHQQDSNASPLQGADFQAEIQRLKAASPPARSENRVETPDMLQRPKTSGGAPGERAKQFHKKVAPATLSAQQPALDFPSPSPTTTVLYAAEVHEDGVIGIALGSPTMAAPWTQSPPPNDFVTRNTGTITEISSHRSFTDSIESKQEVQKPKISRWKSLFKKSPSLQQQPDKPFYQLQQSRSPARADSHHEEESQEWSIPAKQDARSASPATFNPDIRKSRKVPEFSYPALGEKPRARTEAESMTGRPKANLTRTATSPRPAAKNSPNYSPIVPKVVVSSSGSQNSSPRPLGEKPLLDVDIPTIQMERYSVMFGSLLQSNNGSSSLLARRQGNTEKLKPLNELSAKREGNAPQNGILKPPQRRATSPSLSKSPTVSLSLFPPPGGQREGKTPSPRMSSVHRARPLRRSKTAPASSPNRESFGRSSGEGPELSQGQRASEDEEQNLNTPQFTPTPSSRRSFDSDSEEVPIMITRAPSPWKPRMKEPEWEIVSKPSTNPVSQTPPASAPSQSRAEPQVSSSPRSAEQAAQSKKAATVGVARQVSVSRAGSARRDLLKPIVRTDSVEKLVDKKPLTPTLVELKNRKSQRVQLVDA